MKLFIDECLSPRLAYRLNASGLHDAVHPIDIGRRARRDDQVLDYCLVEDRVIVTANARDFRKLMSEVELHPGLIVLPVVHREMGWSLLNGLIEFLGKRGDPMRLMVNHVAEIERSGAVKLSVLAATDE